MKNVICFDNINGSTFYFNFGKQTFVESEKADLSDNSFWTNDYFAPQWVIEIALSEFNCSLNYLETHGIQVRSLEIIF